MSNQYRRHQHPPREPHEVLAVPRDATQEQINAAYRRALRRLHPDTQHTNTTNQPNSQTDSRRGEPAAQLHPALTLADLQVARELLLHRAHQRAHQRAREQPSQARIIPADTDPRTEPTTGPTTQMTEPIVATDQRHPRQRGYFPSPREPDILAGPVRYHGPPT